MENRKARSAGKNLTHWRVERTDRIAPVSFNIKAISADGFDVMLTIRGTDSAEMMPRALKALEWLTTQGFTPNGRYQAPSAQVGNGNGVPAANGNGQTAPICPTHNKPMKPSKFGGWYCPVKIADDDGTGRPLFCKQQSTE